MIEILQAFGLFAIGVVFKDAFFWAQNKLRPTQTYQGIDESRSILNTEENFALETLYKMVKQKELVNSRTYVMLTVYYSSLMLKKDCPFATAVENKLKELRG